MVLKSITVPKFKSESKKEQQLSFNLHGVNYRNRINVVGIIEVNDIKVIIGKHIK